MVDAGRREICRFSLMTALTGWPGRPPSTSRPNGVMHRMNNG
jgi:hypothetical protein